MPTFRFRNNYSDDLVLKDGNIGINTSSPSYKLDIADGNTKNINANVTGVATFTSYSGYLKSNQNVDNINVKNSSGTLSGEIIVGAGKTLIVSESIEAGQGNILSLKVNNTFNPPIGGTNDRPSAPQPGSLYYNKDFRTIEYWDGNFWRQVDNTATSGRGLFFAGDTGAVQKKIGYISIPTFGNSNRFGDLSASFYLNSAFGSSTRGISGGAYPAPGTVIYEYVTIASEGNALSFGNLATNSVFGRGAASSSTRGILAGYYPENVTMEYVEIDTLGNGTDFGDLTVARAYPGGMSSSTRAVFGGGFLGGGSQLSRDTLDYVTIASKGNAVDFGNLTSHRILYDGALSSSTRGVMTSALVYNGPSAPDWTSKIMDYVTIASTGNAVEFGESGGDKHSGTAASTQTRGVFMGGTSRSGPSIVNIIDYITIAQLGNGHDFGDMDTPIRYGGGTSDSHGGLGGF